MILYQTEDGRTRIQCRFENETIWLTQKLISVLFDKGRSTITEHLKNIFETGELDKKAVCRDFRHTAESEFGKAATCNGCSPLPERNTVQYCTVVCFLPHV